MRMKSDLPKVLHPLGGKPLVNHVIDTVRSSGIEDIIVVVGYSGELVIQSLPPGVSSVWQREQKGTGHAVMQAEESLRGFDGPLYVACGDVPLISAATIDRMLAEAAKPGVMAVVLSMVPAGPTGYGRIVKDADGTLSRIIEEKDASDEEKRITEVNTGTYVFNREILFRGLRTVTTNNAQGEYYLPDVFDYIKKAGGKTGIICLDDPIEGSGVNSPEELRRLEEYLNKRGN